MSFQILSFFNFFITIRCGGCGLSLAEIQARGRLGCPTCYMTYRNELYRFIPTVQSGARRHYGKVPGIKGRIDKAVMEERYEDASSLLKTLDQVFDGHDLEAPG